MMIRNGLIVACAVSALIIAGLVWISTPDIDPLARAVVALGSVAAIAIWVFLNVGIVGIVLALLVAAILLLGKARV